MSTVNAKTSKVTNEFRTHTRRRLADHFIIPPSIGQAFHVKKGQILRIYQVEDRQVADCVFFNPNDPREAFSVGQTWLINSILHTGGQRCYKYLYSKPPRENLMLTVVEDTVKVHLGYRGGRCSRRTYEVRDDLPDHRSCQGNLEEALVDFGIDADGIIDMFLAFQNADVDEYGMAVARPSVARRGDYIEFRAEMDILAAISACPSDTVVTNDYEASPIGIRIFDVLPSRWQGGRY